MSTIFHFLNFIAMIKCFLFRFPFPSTLFALILLFGSCKKDVKLESLAESSLTAEEAEVLQCGMGHSLDSITVSDDYVIVDGDMVLDRDELKKSYLYLSNEASTGGVSERQTVYDVAFTLTDAKASTSLTVFNGIPSSSPWFAGFIPALTAWNDIPNCKITFVTTSNRSSADIIVVLDDDTDSNPSLPDLMKNLQQSFARACAPTGGNPGRFVSLRTSNPPNTGTATQVISHELGHTIGFRHAVSTEGNSTQSGCGGSSTGKVFVPGTPFDDPTSIMSPTATPNSINSINANDACAANMLYPDVVTVPSAAADWVEWTGFQNRWEVRLSSQMSACQGAFRLRFRVRNNTTNVESLVPVNLTNDVWVRAPIELRRNTTYTITAEASNYRGDITAISEEYIFYPD